MLILMKEYDCLQIVFHCISLYIISITLMLNFYIMFMLFLLFILCQINKNLRESFRICEMCYI